MSAAKTSNERVAEFRQRMHDQGLKEYRNVWGHPDDEERVKAYVAKLVRKRLRGN